MIMKKYKIVATVLIAFLIGFSSCTKDLDTEPLDDDITTSESVYQTTQDFRQVLAKLYAGYALTGQQGPAGDADIQGIDEGFSNYLRQYWVAQEIPTDEVVVAWDDEGLPEFNYQTWNSSNDFVMAMYSRIFYQIALCNEFVRNAEGEDNQEIQNYLAEARFLRALSYWHALDLYGGNVPFVTEEDGVGAYNPEQTNAQNLFTYIESELKAVEETLVAPQENEYGRADKAAAWTLLAKLYLNAEVYIGESRYDECVTYCNKVINQGGYSLESNYEHLFLADNHTADGVIFAINFDGANSKTYGGTNFIIHAAVGGDMKADSIFGIDGGWAGHRVTPDYISMIDDGQTHSGYQTPNPDNAPEIYVQGDFQSGSGYGSNWSPQDAPPLVESEFDSIFTGRVYFAEANAEFTFTEDRDGETVWGINSDGNLEQDAGNLSISEAGVYSFEVNLNSDKLTVVFNQDVNLGDSRDMFFTYGQTLQVNSIPEFTNGYAVSKWKNITSTGEKGKDPAFTDTDFPMFRLADVYLMYAEAVARNGGGDVATAVEYINQLRERAYGDDSGNITADQLTPEFVLDERARELYWEGHRRTDLIRYGLYTGGDYLWAWKGNVQGGNPTSDYLKFYPIPSSEVNANPNLVQNPGY